MPDEDKECESCPHVRCDTCQHPLDQDENDDNDAATGDYDKTSEYGDRDKDENKEEAGVEKLVPNVYEVD